MHATLRPLRGDDLADVFALQADSYPPTLCDSLAALASRLQLADGGCHLAEMNQRAVGYILAHPWIGMQPPALDTVLSMPPGDAPRVLYVHDLSVSAAAKGGGFGARLLDAALDAGRRGGLVSAELVAVPGAAGYWQRMGFRPLDTDPALARKVRLYGDGAVYMGRAL
ncbi:MAG: GNAT family N-acetyltransferase [Lysobacter sp.]